MAKRQKVRERTRAGFFAAAHSKRSLLKTRDHGDPVAIYAKDIGATGDRWVEPFLAANQIGLRRLDLRPEIRVDPNLRVLLKPGPRIGAIPLLSPSTRKVAAGLLVEPRFHWAALGSMFNAIGFSVEPRLGGGLLVPGSAREVPPWILAGPVIERIGALLRHRKRGFVERGETRSSPRGRVEWTTWATTHIPRGRWTTFPCRFSEPNDDPDLIAAIRWTLLRLEEDLSSIAWSLPARYLLNRTAELQTSIGPGMSKRPTTTWMSSDASEWVTAAVEAMTWVAEERGLGGARSLDGLSWDLSIDAVWEAWVASFSSELARNLGMVASPFKAAKRALRWTGPIHSMSSLVPDVEIRSADRVLWLDAKYKAHLDLLSHRGWQGLSEEVREEHRADLHQALAYASLSDVPHVDTLLVYPQIGSETRTLGTIASVTSGRRRVRLILASVPFGYRNPDHKESHLKSFRELLAA